MTIRTSIGSAQALHANTPPSRCLYVSIWGRLESEDIPAAVIPKEHSD
jgi:hypothetical protein